MISAMEVQRDAGILLSRVVAGLRELSVLAIARLGETDEKEHWIWPENGSGATGWPYERKLCSEKETVMTRAEWHQLTSRWQLPPRGPKGMKQTVQMAGGQKHR